MVWSRSVVIVLAACSFAPHDSQPTDAPVAIDAVVDAAPDAPPTLACTATAMGMPMQRGVLGATGQGDAKPDLACPPGELPIGFAFATTPTSPPDWNQRVVKTTHVRCGAIAVMSDGSVRTTPDPTLVTWATGSCNNWPAGAEGSELDCPAGAVVVAMTDNEATSGGTHSLFDDVAMTCATLDATGMLTATHMTMAFTDTGADTDRPQMPACNPGEAVARLGVEAGCGQDALILECTPLACM